MYLINSVKKTIVYLLVLTCLFITVPSPCTAYGDTLRYYNYNTNSIVNYNGKQVLYTYNNRELSLSNPGILVNGTALADYEELFVKELGLQASRKENTITLTDGTTTLSLTIGSKKAILNDEKQTMSVAPIKLKFDDTIQYYVPTRFVAEAFGFNYVWNSATSTAKLTKTLLLSIDQKTVLYNNTFYTASYKENSINLNMPILFYNRCVLAPAKTLFEALECTYSEENSQISIEKGDISIHMELNSDIALVNEFTFHMDSEPLAITNQKTNATTVYVPLEFVVTMLGYQAKYLDTFKNFEIQDTDYTGKALCHPDLKPFLQAAEAEEEIPQPIQYYFEWKSGDISDNNSTQKTITKVAAYAIENADVLEIYGVTRDDINDFMDSYALVFELESVISPLDTQFFVDFTTAHLNYALMTTINHSTKFFFMIPYDSQWQFVEKEGYVQVYFMTADLSLEDLKISSVEKTTEVKPEEPVIVYPENQLIFPLPEKLEKSEIYVQDNYLEDNFQIFIPGNHMDFYEQNPYINPYDFINSVNFMYDESTEETIITCHTAYLCGFQYVIKDAYISVLVGKPSEIYNKIVVLDAGHGGKDPGAVRENVSEKDINFSILYTYAKELFENSDIKVYYTRETDKFISLNDRARFASLVNADLFISLHINASEYESANGTEVFYSKANNNTLASGLNSYKLAGCLANHVSNAFDSKLRGVTKSDYYVVQYNSVPAVLIELGFISNYRERSKLVNKNYQQKVAEAIYQSVIDIFSLYPTGR